MSRLLNPVILLVDANETALTAIAAMLNHVNFETHCVRSQRNAVIAARAIELDLVICDIDVDGVSGSDIIEEIRTLPDREDVPVMFLSDRQVPDVILRNHGDMASYHLRKPVEPTMLLDVVDKCMWMPHLIQSHLNQSSEKVNKPVTESALQTDEKAASERTEDAATDGQSQTARRPYFVRKSDAANTVSFPSKEQTF